MRTDIEGVAFDLDGTLYPNYRLNIRLIPFAIKELPLLAAFGKTRTIIRKEQEDGLIQYDNFYQHQAEVTARLLNAPAQIIKEKIERLIYRGWEPFFKKIDIFYGVKETLIGLHNSGYKLGLLSDFPPETKLEYLGISEPWDAVYCSEYSGALKPHSLSFTVLADKMNLPPEKILYVGNSVSYDVAGAKNVGMKTAWIRTFPFNIAGAAEDYLKTTPISKFLPEIRYKKGPKPDFSFNNYRQLFDYMLH
ncbi:HAD family hydrolase [Treponema sp. R6D11]